MLEEYFLSVEQRLTKVVGEDHVTNVEERLSRLESSLEGRLTNLEERVSTLEAMGEVLSTRGQQTVRP